MLGFADWNDTVNLAAGAESVFTATLYGKALLEMIDLDEALGNAESAGHYRLGYEAMKQRVNAHAWDGEWYVGYFDADGSPLGSHSNTDRADLPEQPVVGGDLGVRRSDPGEHRSRIGPPPVEHPARDQAERAGISTATIRGAAASRPTRRGRRRTAASSCTRTRG